MAMIPRSAVRPADARAARFMLGLTIRELADLAGVGEATVDRFEAGDPSRHETRAAILGALVLGGARFHGSGDVRHADGRVAPTREAVGRLAGERLRRARQRLGISVMEVAQLAHLTSRTLRRMEAEPHDLTQRPTLGFFRLVGVLQRAGYMFGPQRHGGISGDRLLVEPRSRARPRKDMARYHTKGLHVPGMGRIEEPAGED